MTWRKDHEDSEMAHIQQQVRRAYKRAFESASADRELAGLVAAKSKFEELTGNPPDGQKLAKLLADIR